MPARSTNKAGASPVPQIIPDLPRVGPQLIEVPGMLEYDQRLQKWWDKFREASVGTQVEQGKTMRKLVETSTVGLTTLEARLTLEETVRASADSALASRATALETTLDTPTTGLVARVAVIESSYVDASGAYAQALSAISAEMTGPGGSIYATIDAESTARVSADTALAVRATNLEASVDTPTTGLLSRVSVIEGAYVDAAGAYAQATSAISAELSGPFGTIYSTVQSESSVRALADGFLEGKYTLKVMAGDVVTGMNITSSSGGGTDISEISFLASSFKIYNGTSSIAPFQVVSGQVRITGDLVLVPADVTGLGTLATASSVAYDDLTGTKPPDNADVTLSAINGGLTVTGGGITLSAGGAIKGGATDFSTGVGFFLGYEGGAYKFRVGDPAGARIEWDGSAWTVVNFGASTPTFTLSLTNSTGNPLYDPVASPAGPYAPGQAVTITAPLSAGASPFIKWSGSVPDMACVVDEYGYSTTVYMTHDIALTADY